MCKLVKTMSIHDIYIYIYKLKLQNALSHQANIGSPYGYIKYVLYQVGNRFVNL